MKINTLLAIIFAFSIVSVTNAEAANSMDECTSARLQCVAATAAMAGICAAYGLTSAECALANDVATGVCLFAALICELGGGHDGQSTSANATQQLESLEVGIQE